MFHLFTHAFFKALLFLGAGSVIHGMHHEQDMRRMGGVAKYMPLTYAAMMIGTIAIIGLGVPHTQLGFAGFFSKDAIIETAFAAGENGITFAQLAFWFGIIAALLTLPDLPPVLNVAQPGPVEMAALLRAAGRDFATAAAPQTAIAEVALDVTRLTAFLAPKMSLPVADPRAMLAEIALLGTEKKEQDPS